MILRGAEADSRARGTLLGIMGIAVYGGTGVCMAPPSGRGTNDETGVISHPVPISNQSRALRAGSTVGILMRHLLPAYPAAALWAAILI